MLVKLALLRLASCMQLTSGNHFMRLMLQVRNWLPIHHADRTSKRQHARGGHGESALVILNGDNI